MVELDGVDPRPMRSLTDRHSSYGHDFSLLLFLYYTICVNYSLVWIGMRFIYNLCRGKLRQIMYRCLHQAMYVLGAPVGMISRLVPIVVNTLVCARSFHFL